MAEFIVTVPDYDYDGEPVTANLIRSSLMYGSSGWRDVTVRKYDTENEIRRRKIPAIKRIRTLLQCSLVDAKFLVDTAERTGQSAWSTVSVTHDGTEDGFRVIDNS